MSRSDDGRRVAGDAVEATAALAGQTPPAGPADAGRESFLARLPFAHTWRALRHRNFRLYFAGQGTSIAGTWMTRLATSWLVYDLTKSALLLGLVSFAGLMPTFLLAPFAGVWIEGVDKRKMLVVTQVAAALQSFALAALTLTGVITPAHVIALAIFQGVVNAFDAPGRQAFLVQMVAREDLSNAIALNSSMVNGGRLIGPALAGVLIAYVGIGGCFLADGLSYFAVIASLLMMRLNRHVRTPTGASVLEQLREGWDYVRTFRPIRTVLLLVGLLALMGFPYTVLLPIVASEILHGDATTLALLTGAAGFGALASAISLAARKSVRGLTRMLQVAAFALGIGLIGFGLSRWLWASMALMALVGFGLMQALAVSNTIIQMLAPDNKRARVMSYYVMALFGMAPFGAMLVGALAHRVGAPITLVVAGACCLLGAAWFTVERPKIRDLMRPIYEQMGLIPARRTAPAAALPPP